MDWITWMEKFKDYLFYTLPIVNDDRLIRNFLRKRAVKVMDLLHLSQVSVTYLGAYSIGAYSGMR